MNSNNNLIMIIILVIIVGGVGFFGGMKYQQSVSLQNNRQGFYGQGRGRTMMGGRGGSGLSAGRQVIGTILSQDNNSITVKLNDGSTKIVILNDSTNINKASKASKTDLTVGSQIAVFGAANSDGSVTAQNIQLNPIFRGGGPNPSSTAAPSPSTNTTPGY